MSNLASTMEAERNVLGACLLEGHAVYRVIGILRPVMFLDPDHDALFRAMLELATDGQPIDPVLLGARLPGLMALIGILIAGSIGSSNLEAYARLVAKFWSDRELARVGREIQGLAVSREDDKLGQAMQLLTGLSDQGQGRGYASTKDCLAELLDYLNERHIAGSDLMGLSSGYLDLDDILQGLSPGNLYIIGGRPGMGKTTVGMNIARHAALAGETVLVHSLEMPHRQLWIRMAADVSGIDFKRARSGQLEEDEWPRLSAAITRLKDQRLFIDDTPALSLMDLFARTKRAKMEHGKLGLILIDYLGLMRAEGYDSRVQEIGAISRGLKALAKELDTPIIALAQLNRKSEDRGNKRPQLADLRDSGEIEQDADAVIMVHRESAVNPDGALARNGIAELLVLKNRHGEQGEVRLLDRLKFCRYENAHKSVYAISEEKKSGKGGYSNA